MKKMLIFIGVGLACVGCLFVLGQSFKPMPEMPFKYTSKVKVLKDGMAFFDVQLKNLAVTIEKLIYRPGKNDVFIKAVHFSFPVLKRLQRYPNVAVEHLDHYVPYRDILRFPMESLALAEIYTLKGTLACTGKKMQAPFSAWYCTLERDEEKPVFFTLGCLTDVQTPFEQMVCPDVRISLPLGKMVAVYARYAKGLGVSFPFPDKAVLELRLTLPEQPLITLFEQGMADAQVQVLP